uniref:IS1096 element passenger TnpR family protein n=1 Tax=Alistipes sp. TaxID=1872444 RepID=UPI0040568932
MNIVFKYRMLSDESDNFVRDFEVYPDMTLAEFHRFLLRALGYDDCMASIFKSDAEWRPVEEFSEIDMGEDMPGVPRCMENVSLMEVNNNFHDRLIYTFDMLNNRSFYLELIDMQRPAEDLEYPRVAFEHAAVPDQYDPDATEESGSIFEEMMSDYNEFDGDDGYDDEY